ncbi:hypothetical protein ABB02_01845 [Clostridiaceae bacterium JG1575]|nr:hypothetical protein ABB02_01845 [Clostridiaceae bacterium JG1575]
MNWWKRWSPRRSEVFDEEQESLGEYDKGDLQEDKRPEATKASEEALKVLEEDESVRLRMREALGCSPKGDQASFGKMLGDGVGVLKGSLVKGLRGEDLLEEEPQAKPKDNKKA